MEVGGGGFGRRERNRTSGRIVVNFTANGICATAVRKGCYSWEGGRGRLIV